MTLETILSISTAFFGGSILSGIIVWKTRKAVVKSADAKATTDVADSLKATGEIYNMLTEITRSELLEMNKQIASLKNVASVQDVEISTLKKTLYDYEIRCGDCLKPKK